MVDAHYFYYLILNPVNSDVGKAGENQLAGAFDPPLTTEMRRLSQVAAAIVPGLGHVHSSVGIVSLNVPNDVAEVVSGGSGPTHAY
jgi:hypothetical protein